MSEPEDLKFVQAVFAGKKGKPQIKLELVTADGPWADVVTEGSIVGCVKPMRSDLKKKLEAHDFSVADGCAVLPPELVPVAPVPSLPTQTSGDTYENNLTSQMIFSDPDAAWFYERDDVPDLAYGALGKMMLSDPVTETWPEAGGHYVELPTRLGVMAGSGDSWAEATARAIAAFHEVRARAKYKVELISQGQANAFIDVVHRHHRRPQGDKFRLGAWAVVNDVPRLVGVVVVGRPTSRHLQSQGAWEVTRLAVSEHSPSLCSKLYAAAWKEAHKLGCRRLVTFILAEEPGTTLRAVGWQRVSDVAGGGSWSRSAREREDNAPTGLKQRWEIWDWAYASTGTSIQAMKKNGIKGPIDFQAKEKAAQRKTPPGSLLVRFPWPADAMKPGSEMKTSKTVKPDRIEVMQGQEWVHLDDVVVPEEQGERDG